MNLRIIKIIFAVAIVCATSAVMQAAQWGHQWSGGPQWGAGGLDPMDDSRIARIVEAGTERARAANEVTITAFRSEIARIQAGLRSEVASVLDQARRAAFTVEEVTGHAEEVAREEVRKALRAAESAFDRKAAELAKEVGDRTVAQARQLEEQIRVLQGQAEASAETVREGYQRAQQIAEQTSRDKIAYMKAEEAEKGRLAVENARAIAKAAEEEAVNGMMAKVKGFLDSLKENGSSLEAAITAAGPAAQQMMGTYVEGQKKIEADKLKNELIKQKKEIAAAKAAQELAHKQWAEKATQVFGLLGEFVTNKKKMGMVVLGAGGIYASVKAVQLAHWQAQKYLATPKIVEKTNVPTWYETLFGGSKVTYPLIKDVMLDEHTHEQLLEVASAVRNTKKNGGIFRGCLLWGPPGTGKTMMANALANDSDCLYVQFTGSSLFKLSVEEALVSIDKLFDWAESQKKAVVICIDEVEGLVEQRGGANPDPKKQQIMTHLMAKTGTESDKWMLVLCTNRPQDIDEAFHRRAPKRIQVKLPALEQRIRILENTIKRKLEANKVNTSLLSKAKIAEIAAQAEGMCGSDLTGLVAALHHRTFESAGNKLTAEIIDKTVDVWLQEFNDLKNGFQRADKPAMGARLTPAA